MYITFIPKYSILYCYFKHIASKKIANKKCLRADTHVASGDRRQLQISQGLVSGRGGTTN